MATRERAARLDNTVLPSAAAPDSVAYDEITQAKLAQALQSDYGPAASPHAQPDPHDGVGGENQDEEKWN